MYEYTGIKERFEQLKKANDFVKYTGLKNLDKVITLELNERSNDEQVKILMTYRRKTRLELRKLLKGC